MATMGRFEFAGVGSEVGLGFRTSWWGLVWNVNMGIEPLYTPYINYVPLFPTNPQYDLGFRL